MINILIGGDFQIINTIQQKKTPRLKGAFFHFGKKLFDEINKQTCQSLERFLTFLNKLLIFYSFYFICNKIFITN